MKLLNIIHVRWEEPEDGEPYLVASSTGVEGAFDDDGPVKVGVYKLVSVLEARRVISTKPTKGQRILK